MRKLTKTAGLLFLAAASVYSYRVIGAASGTEASQPVPATVTANVMVEKATDMLTDPLIAAPGEGNTDVKLIEEATDPFASASPTTAPATAAAPTSQPSEGRSVSSSEVSVSDAGTVEIHVNDANLVEVLRMLSLQSQKNIIASKDVHGTVTANLYDVTVREALDAILHANGFAYREKGNFIYVYTTKEIAEIEKAEKVMKTEVFRTYYTPAADAAIMIKPVLSAGGGQVAVTAPAKVGIASAAAGGGGDNYSQNDVLVVTDYPENIDAVRKLLADLDRRPQQILLEATILRATLNDDNALGVDFNVVGGVDLAGVFNPVSQIIGSTVNTNVPANNPVNGAGTGNAFSGPINGGVKMGWVSDSVSVFLSALEQTTDTAILANPKVLALNKQQGEVFVGNEDGYYTTLTTETTTSQSVESLKTGTRLIFRPFIANDGYIRMEVHPEDSDGQVKANGLPSKSTTEITSNIMVKDGHTIVIGGLFRESTVSGRSQIPFLGNIPVAGLLFRSQKDSTKREEVIILLTPHIVKDDAAYSHLSEEEMKRGEEMRVGVRKGLMPWGRQRLAEGWYDGAKKEMAKPHPDLGKVKFNLDCALNLNPLLNEAIELRDQVTGHQLNGTDGSSIRSFVRRAIITDVTPTTSPATTAFEDADQATTQPSETETAAAPATQPSHEATASTEAQVTDVSDSFNRKDAHPDALTGTTTESAEVPAEPMEESAEASVDEVVTVPTQAEAEAKPESSVTLIEEPEQTATEPMTDPLALPSTQPAVAESSEQTADESSETTETSTDEVVPGSIQEITK